MLACPLTCPHPSLPSDMMYAWENVSCALFHVEHSDSYRTLNLATGPGLYTSQAYIHLNIYRNEHTGRMI